MLQAGLEDFYVKYTLFVCLEQQQSRPVTLDALHANIQDLFNEYGVQIMSPNYVVDPAAPKVVPKQAVVRRAGCRPGASAPDRSPGRPAIGIGVLTQRIGTIHSTNACSPSSEDDDSGECARSRQRSLPLTP